MGENTNGEQLPVPADAASRGAGDLSTSAGAPRKLKILMLHGKAAPLYPSRPPNAISIQVFG